MKKLVILLLLLLLFSPVVFAKIDSIYEYLQRIDKNYKIVLGAKAKGGDSLAAIDIALGIKRYNTNEPDLETVIETEVKKQESKILIGHPCDNGLISLSCEAWPYQKGEAVIRVMGNDLVIAGSTIEDTRRAARVVRYYKSYPVLKEAISIVVTETSFQQINVSKEKTADEIVCGDGICDPGERCYTDCAEMTCFDACEAEGFAEAACRDQKSNPNVPSCLPEEQNKGLGYCVTGKVCCCKKSVVEEGKLEPQEKPRQRLSLLQRILLFFKRLFGFVQ